MRKAIRFVLLLIVLLAVCTQAAVAFGAPSGWESVDITVHSEQEQTVVLVSGVLPDDATLPHDAELAVPSGMQVMWVGEILGEDPTKDPELKYVKSTANGMDVYRFTLTKGRTAQVEGSLPSVSTFDGQMYTTALKWTATEDLPEVRVSQRIPQGSQILQADEAATVLPGEAGYSYYSKTLSDVKRGTPVELSFAYSAPAAGSAGAQGSASGAQGSAPGTDTKGMLVVLLVGAGALIGMGYVVSRKMARARAALESQPSVDQVPDEASDDRDDDVASSDAGSGSAVRKRNVVVMTILVLGAVVAGFTIASGRGTSAVVVDGILSRSFGSADACQSSSIALTPNDGVDLATDGAKLLDAFEGQNAIGEVILDVKQSTIEVNWCESGQSEESIRQVLASTGLVTVGEVTSAPEAAPTPAVMDASGKKQTLAIATSSGSFAPNLITLKAGVPAELTFDKGTGCLTAFTIKDLKIRQDLTKAGAVVKLPALKPGTHEFECGQGHPSGQIVVE